MLRQEEEYLATQVDTNTQADKIIISLGKLAAAVQMQIVLRK
jgi:hypothetical protein